MVEVTGNAPDTNRAHEEETSLFCGGAQLQWRDLDISDQREW